MIYSVGPVRGCHEGKAIVTRPSPNKTKHQLADLVTLPRSQPGVRVIVELPPPEHRAHIRSRLTTYIYTLPLVPLFVAVIVYPFYICLSSLTPPSLPHPSLPHPALQHFGYRR